MTSTGDCFDRYKIRLQEMRESTYIIKQGLFYLKNHLFLLKKKVNDFNHMKRSMESLIKHFIYTIQGHFFPPKKDFYLAVEAPKGEFGLYFMSSQTKSFFPYRLRIRAPGFFHLSVLDFLIKNSYLSDLVTVIGTLDLVFGEIDR